MIRSVLPFALLIPAAWAQLTPADTVFAGLSARTRLLAYQTAGGDTKTLAPLMSQQNYRSLTHAMVAMDGKPWTPDTELPTLLDFAISSKIVGTGENLTARTMFLYDSGQVEKGPYRMRLSLLKPDGTKEAAVEPGINIGAAKNRKAGEIIGLSFDPSKLVQPGLHTIQATLEDSEGRANFEYYRTFVLVSDLNKRVAVLEKAIELSADQKSPAALDARHTLETVKAAHAMYYAPGFQGLTGYVFTGMRASGLGLKEAFDYEAGLARAAKMEVPDRGDLFLSYRSTFDGKLVPYRVYVPASYDRSKKYPLVMLLHGAGGDETDFMEAYQGLWPKMAEQHGFILASVTGRGPLSGYSKESGGEQDVLDVMELVKSRYNVGKIFLGGHSMGGQGTWRLGTLYADKWAGLIPIAGTNAQVQINPKMPVMIVCGEKDALVAVAGCRAAAEKAKSANAPVKYNEYATGDHLSVAVMSIPDIFAWLDEQAGRSR